MSRQVLEIEQMLRQLIIEHQKLLGHVETHEQAMRRFDLRAMDESAKLQEAARSRIAAMELRRKSAAVALAKASRINGELTIARLAELFPANAGSLLSLRDELKTIAGEIAGKTFVASRLAGAVLGHLNTAVRLFAGVTDRTGVYTKSGSPIVARRNGIMNAIA